MSSHIVSEALLEQRSAMISENEYAVRLEAVGVRYRVPSERVLSFKEYMIRRFQGQITMRDFWALNQVDLNIRSGETIGLIGPNGAGKSTLLKLVARVLHPTNGRILVRGKVAPLLEFGAGFHPDLTGRENIFLNGALLGFTAEEMQAKFDRIVDFAEMWDFIDVPLRNYSSGMTARLGFSVATDVEPDILLLDEVLSVGDESFQRKSLARMKNFRDMGATIILVSHNLEMIKLMCQRAVWLNQGEVNMIAEASEVIESYRSQTEAA